MAITTLRDQAAEISPPWLKGQVGGGILYAVGLVCDALVERTRQGVRLRFPEAGTPTALGYLGNDKDIERPPGQTDAGFAAQVRKGFDTWVGAGGARIVLSQLLLHFVNRPTPRMRTVDGLALWHSMDVDTGVVTRDDYDGDNWSWDGTGRRFWTWVIVDGAGIWTMDVWDDTDASVWGDGGMWGSNDLPEDEGAALNAIVAKWKGAHDRAQVIVTFDHGTFAASNLLADNVDGDGEDSAWRADQPALFLQPLLT